MNPLIDHIEYLMTSHDCVVVPGWGAFIAQYSDSVHNDLFLKPQRNIGFNASIIHNDGLLANSLAKRKQITFAEALAEIENNVSVYRQLISDGSEIPFGRLGFFKSSENGGLEFVPFHHEQNYDNFFGLQAFSFPTLAEQKAAQESETITSVEKDVEPEDNEKRIKINWFPREALKIAASIIILIGMTFVLTTPIVFEKNNQEFATMNIPEPKKPAKITKPVIVVNKKAAPQQEYKKVEAPKKVQQQETIAATNEQTGKYCLVIATFKSQKQVDKFFEYNKDVNSTNVLVKKNNYMVYFDRSDDYNKMVKLSKSLPSKFKQSYIAMQ